VKSPDQVCNMTQAQHDRHMYDFNVQRKGSLGRAFAMRDLCVATVDERTKMALCR